MLLPFLFSLLTQHSQMLEGKPAPLKDLFSQQHWGYCQVGGGPYILGPGPWDNWQHQLLVVCEDLA